MKNYTLEELIDNIVKTNPVISGYEVDKDCGVGTITLTKNNTLIYATPFWEGHEGIPVEIFHNKDDDEQEFMSVDFPASGELETDTNKYVSIMTDFLITLNK